MLSAIAHSISHIHDIIGLLQGTTAFPVITLVRAHHNQFAIEDVQKNATLTYCGLFEFSRITFGLRSTLCIPHHEIKVMPQRFLFETFLP